MQTTSTTNFYLAAGAIGVVLALIWIVWLLGVRAYVRASRRRPGMLLSIIQVIVVLALMLGAYHVSDWVMAQMGRDLPADIKLFRRIWIIVWFVGMVGSIQIFLDIRQMMDTPSQPRPATGRSAPRKPVRRR